MKFLFNLFFFVVSGVLFMVGFLFIVGCGGDSDKDLN